MCVDTGEKPSTLRVKREGSVAGQRRRGSDIFLGNLKRKRGHTVFSEANSFFSKSKKLHVLTPKGMRERKLISLGRGK